MRFDNPETIVCMACELFSIVSARRSKDNLCRVGCSSCVVAFGPSGLLSVGVGSTPEYIIVTMKESRGVPLSFLPHLFRQH